MYGQPIGNRLTPIRWARFGRSYIWAIPKFISFRRYFLDDTALSNPLFQVGSHLRAMTPPAQVPSAVAPT